VPDGLAPVAGRWPRIDLASNRVVAVIKIPPGTPAGIAVAGGSIWVAAGGDGVARIEAATNRLLGTIRLDLHAERVAASGEVIWVGGLTTDPIVEIAGGVARIDAATGHVQEIVPTGLPVGLAAAAGAVLITEPDTVGGALECIHPGETPAGMGLQPALGELAVGGGAVWIADRRGSLVYRLEPGRIPC
jgi:hypothetical protein